MRPEWFRLDCDMPDHPALTYLHEEGRHSAIWLYVWSIAYSAKRLTDGFVPHALPRQWGFKPRDVEQLLNLGLWSEYENAPGVRAYLIVGYLDRQPSREEWESMIRNRRNAALARWGNKGRT